MIGMTQTPDATESVVTLELRDNVAVLTLGSARRFLLRPKGGGTSVKLNPAPGDLLVMGGTCQRTWQHAVPKSAAATGPRISVTLRHHAPLDPS